MLPDVINGVFHAVVTDRFYTLVQQALQLLHRHVYSIGTIMPNRLGISAAVMEKNRPRASTIKRGITRFAAAKACTTMTALVWWGNRPVQVLAKGGSCEIGLGGACA